MDNSDIAKFLISLSRDLVPHDKKIGVVVSGGFDSSVLYWLIKEVCNQFNKKLYISNNLKIALKFDLDGLYLPAFNNKLNYKNINSRKNFKIIGSAHNYKEVKIKENQGCKEIFITPIFYNPKNKTYLDIVRFNYLNLTTKINSIALGGINEENLKKLKCTKVIGFAGISWIKKTGLKLIRPV